MQRTLATGLTLLLASCSSATPPPEHATATPECSTADLGCLPDSREEREQRSYRMRRGWLLAAHALLMPPPPGPRDLDFWAELDVWLAHREDAVEAARDELVVAAREDHRQHIVAHAILGLMYEHVARELASIEVPAEGVPREPEGPDYHDALGRHARPFVDRAKAAYRDCAQNAFHPVDMRPWSRFCEHRDQALPSVFLAPERPPRAETTVEVIRD